MQLLYDIVVSSDNNDYLAWQCMLFHHSCVTHLGKVPIIVVHGDDRPLVAGYHIMEKKGGIIQRLPSMRSVNGIDYAARNVCASLKGVKTSAENILLCDPDFVFLRPIDFSKIAANLNGEAINIEQISYMTVGDHNRAILEAVCRKAWISTSKLDDIKISGGTPYLVPTQLRRYLAREWATMTEDYLAASFLHHGVNNSEVWISVMWGFILAALRNDIPITLTSMCVSNQAGVTSNINNRQIVHYCYGDDIFDKRRFTNEEAALKTVWKTHASEGTVNGAIAKALHEAAQFYDLV